MAEIYYKTQTVKYKDQKSDKYYQAVLVCNNDSEYEDSILVFRWGSSKLIDKPSKEGFCKIL